MKQKIALFIILPAALTLLSGCISMESVNPLSPPRASVPDHRLEGMWRGKGDKKEDFYLLISYRKSGMGEMMYLGPEDGNLGDSGEIDSMRQDFFVTHTAQGNYLNLTNSVLTVGGKLHRDHPGTYTFAKYRFSWLGHLVTASTKADTFVKAVQDGKLKGKLTRDKKGNINDVLLTDSSDRILRYIESSKPADVFDPETKLDKIGPK